MAEKDECTYGVVSTRVMKKMLITVMKITRPSMNPVASAMFQALRICNLIDDGRTDMQNDEIMYPHLDYRNL